MEKNLFEGLDLEALGAIVEFSEKFKTFIPKIKALLPMLKQLETIKFGKDLKEGQVIIYTSALTDTGIMVYANVCEEDKEGNVLIIEEKWRGDLFDILGNLQSFLPG